MADPVNLHETKSDFNTLISEAADFFGIREVFIEKDYWITHVLKCLAYSEYSGSVVSKEAHPYRKVTVSLTGFQKILI